MTVAARIGAARVIKRDPDTLPNFGNDVLSDSFGFLNSLRAPLRSRLGSEPRASCKRDPDTLPNFGNHVLRRVGHRQAFSRPGLDRASAMLSQRPQPESEQ